MVLGDKIKTEDYSEKKECEWDTPYTILYSQKLRRVGVTVTMAAIMRAVLFLW